MNVHGALMIAILGALVLAITATPGQAQAPSVDREEAVALTTERLLGGSLEGVRLYVDPELHPAGEAVRTWKREVFVTPSAGWLLFVDLMPGANWEHACQYVFVDAASGEIIAFDASVPPERQPLLHEVTAGRDNPPAGVSEAQLARLRERLKTLPKPAPPSRGQAYAFIISGGANQSNNHIRYWNDSAFIYTVLAEYYGYADDHIYVCISDGLDPSPDRSDNTNSPPDLDGDGDDDIQYPATTTYITQVFNELATTLTASDQLFLFTTDHGGQESGWDCYLNLWNWEELRDDQLAALVATLPCESIICCFEQCFSGGMIDDLEGDGRVIATAARYDESSWAMGPSYIYDTFVYHWTSAVGWEDPYGNPVDADTNDDGVVSMHEAFIYAEANDFEQEHPQYNSTPADLGDLLNLFGSMEGVYLAVEEVAIDDDALGSSQGDGDGVIDFQETIELTVTLSNMGTEDGFAIQGTLASTSPHVTLLAAERSFGDIPAGGTGANSLPFVFEIAADVPDGEPLGMSLTLSEEPGSAALTLTATAPACAAAITDLDDSAGGNGNGIADPGETVLLTIAVANSGGCETPALEAILTSASAYLTPAATPQTFGVIPAGGDASVGGFSVVVDITCPPIYTGVLELDLHDAAAYQVLQTLPFVVGQIFADDMEGGEAQWSHFAGAGSWIDEWHLETYRNHTPGGTTSWKCGGAGAAVYGNLLHAILETAPFVLPPGATLTFWHWMSAETSTTYPDHCYDGGRLEISDNNGVSWEPLTPAVDYPYLIRAGGTSGPFPAETPVWSGEFGWQEEEVDLSAYSGTVQLRWVFGSDGAVTQEGWYVDDIQVLAVDPAGVTEELRPVRTVQLTASGPNPVVMGAAGRAGGTLELRFALPAAGEARLDLYDPSGRFVRNLARGGFAAGVHTVAWDGRDDRGRPVGAGAYFYRLHAAGTERIGRVTVVR